MTARALKWILWVALVATVPVRYQLADSEWAPALRLTFLTTLTLLLHLSEGFGGNLWALLLALGVVQSVGYLLAFYALAAVAVRQLEQRASHRAAIAVVFVAALALLAGAASARLYVTPISSRTMYSSLFDVLR